MGEVSVQVTEPRRRQVRRPGLSQIKMCGFCRLFRAMEYAGDPVVLRHQCRECTGFTQLRIVQRRRREDDQQTARAGSKAVVCAEFEMTAVLAICASLAGANFRVHSDCRRAKSSAMSRQRSSEEDSSRLRLDMLFLLPQCCEIADLQTTLITATNKKD